MNDLQKETIEQQIKELESINMFYFSINNVEKLDKEAHNKLVGKTYSKLRDAIKWLKLSIKP